MNKDSEDPINDDALDDSRDSHDDPKEIAEYLIREHGLDGALEAAMDGTRAAQRDGDNYALSVWREIKGEIRKAIAEQAA